MIEDGIAQVFNMLQNSSAIFEKELQNGLTFTHYLLQQSLSTLPEDVPLVISQSATARIDQLIRSLTTKTSR